jgi:cellulose synthase/poly-beta-1,6-N-acetylglucosamine synthase-like glycosyltransferase
MIGPETMDHGRQTTPTGVVVIGRNEGQRLVRCLESALRAGAVSVVYVDSGSTDGSVGEAEALGCEVVELDMDRPFTAARARNAGWRRLAATIDRVQFVDGDCELADGWLRAANTRLDSDDGLAGVAGRLRERFPDATPFNKLCDLEWDAPAGETHALGGVSLFRRAALEQVDGFDESLIAGEEPEMCLRMREEGWRFWRLADDMGHHDADMHRLGQWWTRAVRCGHSQLEVALLHRDSDKRIWAKESRSTFLWATVPVAPTLAAVLAIGLGIGWPWSPLGLLPMGLYPLLVAKVVRSRRHLGEAWRTSLLYATAVTLAKFPQFQGQLKYWRNRLSGRRSGLIEYRKADASAPEAA